MNGDVEVGGRRTSVVGKPRAVSREELEVKLKKFKAEWT